MTSKPSHLSESSIAGKKYEYKVHCANCGAAFDREISDAFNAYLFCCLTCENEHIAIHHILYYAKQTESGCLAYHEHNNDSGYGIAMFYRRTNRYAHRVILEWKLGRTIRNRYLACHTCDNPPCVNPDHLYEGTPKDNARDMSERGRQHYQAHPEKALRGSQLQWTKLTPKQVIEARELYKSGDMSYKEPASMYGVCTAAIRNAVTGRTWAHL